MTATVFDPVRFKQTQRATWNALSSGWSACQDDFERGGSLVTARLLELGGVGPGHRVLDVASGIGEPALTAAAVVGPTGRVTGVDLAEGMVALARRRAGSADNVTFLTADLDSLQLDAACFDVVLSRWGLMFALDRVATFRSLAELLVDGGVLAAAVWGPPAQVPMMSLGYQVLSSRLGLAPTPEGTPGPYSMADPDEVAIELRAAGFVEISVVPFRVPFAFDTARGYVDFTRAAIPPAVGDLLRERFGSLDDPPTWAAVGAAVRSFQDGDGRVSLPSTALLLRAVVRRG